MNTHNQKLSEIKVFLLAFLLILNCCSNIEKQSKLKIKSIYSAVLLDEVFSNFEYSEESHFECGGVKYSLRERIDYKVSGELQKLTVYKPEGILQYSYSELQKDTLLLNKKNSPILQKWTFYDNKLVIGPHDTILLRPLSIEKKIFIPEAKDNSSVLSIIYEFY